MANNSNNAEIRDDVILQGRTMCKDNDDNDTFPNTNAPYDSYYKN